MKFEKPEIVILKSEPEKRIYGREDASAGWNSCCFSGNF